MITRRTTGSSSLSRNVARSWLAAIAPVVLHLAPFPAAASARGSTRPRGLGKLVATMLSVSLGIAHSDANAAGAVDPMFGSSGVVRPQIAIEDYLRVAVPSSGDRFLTVSCHWEYACYNTLSLRRFTRDGQPDATFGTNGVSVIGGTPHEVIVLERADGSLLLAGLLTGPPTFEAAGFVAAVAASGQPDPVFGGRAVLNLAQPVRALAAQSDGKLLVVTAPNATECQGAGWTLQRLSASGVLDPTFGAAGATTSLAVEAESGRNCDLTQIWAEHGGALVIQTSIGLRRLHGDGSLDTTFGTASGVTPLTGTVTRTADGRFLEISGRLAARSVRRYDVNGREDASFGSGGVVSLDIAGAMADFGTVSEVWVNRIAVLDGGNRYVGSMQIEGRLRSTGEWLSGAFIVRFLSDGRLDTAFGKGGKVQMSRSGFLGDSGLFGQSDDKLIVAAGGAVYRLLSGDEPSPGFVFVGLAEPDSVVEGGRARVIVSRTGGADTAISVSYQTVAQDALAELDFTPVSGRLSWAAGDDSDRIVEVPTVNDTIYDDSEEGLEFLIFRITPAEGAPVITSAEQWIAIADDDPRPVTPPPPPSLTPQTPQQGTPGGGGGAIGLVGAIALFGVLAVGLRRRRVMLALRPRDRRRHEGIRHGQSRTVLAQDRLHHLRT